MIIRKHYSNDFRDLVLKSYFTSDESGSSIATRFGLSPGLVNLWIQRHKKRYRELGSESDNNSIFDSLDSNLNNMSNSELTISGLEERVRLLEKQLEEERMRSTCLDKMIEIAERDLHVVIRKKSGAKQSKK